MTSRSGNSQSIDARPLGRTAWGWLTVLVCAAGCDDPALLRPEDVRIYETAKDRTTSPPATESAPAPVPGGLTLRDEAPPGWTDRGRSGLRLASLAIGPPDDGHEVTVIPASGSLEANVSRWLGQLDPAADSAALAERTTAALAAAEKVEVDGVEATVVLLPPGAEAAAESEAILGAAIPLNETGALFVKFKGPADIARREREKFVRFVSSIRWK